MYGGWSDEGENEPCREVRGGGEVARVGFFRLQMRKMKEQLGEFLWKGNEEDIRVA